jgi:hypothetical protein
MALGSIHVHHLHPRVQNENWLLIHQISSKYEKQRQYLEGLSCKKMMIHTAGNLNSALYLFCGPNFLYSSQT